MSKQSKKQPKSPEHILANKKLLQILAVGVLVAIFGWFVLANPILNHLDKQRFLKAEEFLQEIFKNDIQPIAEPTRVEPLNSCRYTSMKLGEGTLFCNTRLRITYEDTSEDDAKKIVDSIASNVIDHLSEDFVREDSVSGIVDYIEPLSCIGSAEFTQGQSATYTTDVRLTCGGEARTEHFPLDN